MMFTIDDIEVFIITHNRANFLKESIFSIKNQTVAPKEIIVLDNESTDDTQEVCQSIEGVKYIKTFGFLGNWNKAREIVAKKYCILFHDDDLLHPQYFENALKILNKHENVSIITTRFQEFHDDKVPPFAKLTNKYFVYESQKDFAKMMYFCTGARYALNWATAIHRTSDLLKLELEYEKYGKFNDWPFIVNMAGKGTSIILDDAICLVRLHKNQDTWTLKNPLTPTQLVNWDACFCHIIKPRFFSINWLCAMHQAYSFRGKYRIFTLPETRNKALRKQMIKYAKREKIYSLWWKACRVLLIHKLVRNVILPYKQKKLHSKFLILECFKSFCKK